MLCWQACLQSVADHVRPKLGEVASTKEVSLKLFCFEAPLQTKASGKPTKLRKSHPVVLTTAVNECLIKF